MTKRHHTMSRDEAAVSGPEARDRSPPITSCHTSRSTENTQPEMARHATPRHATILATVLRAVAIPDVGVPPTGLVLVVDDT